MTPRDRQALAFVTAALASAALAGCMGPVKPEDPVYARIGQLEERLGHIERVVNNQSLLELAQKLDEVRAEVGALRGELETMQHEADKGRERDKALVADLDERLRALEAAGAGAAVAKAGDGGDQVAYDAAFELLKQARYDQAREAYPQNFGGSWTAVFEAGKKSSAELGFARKRHARFSGRIQRCRHAAHQEVQGRFL